MAGSAASICEECQLLKFRLWSFQGWEVKHDPQFMLFGDDIYKIDNPMHFVKIPGISYGFSSQLTPQSHMPSPIV